MRLQFDMIEKMCERALVMTLNVRRIAMASAALLASGLLWLFFMGLALLSGSWLKMSLSYLPLFLTAAILAFLAVLLVRDWHHELKGEPISSAKLIREGWEAALAASYLFLPFVLLYLVFVVLWGLFFLLNALPLLGEFFQVVLSFGPFILNFATMMLALSAIFVLFAGLPSFWTSSSSIQSLIQSTLQEMREHLFTRIFMMFVALIPLAIITLCLVASFEITMAAFGIKEHLLGQVLQGFFLMVPFAILMSFPLIFFFNMAFETQALISKQRE